MKREDCISNLWIIISDGNVDTIIYQALDPSIVWWVELNYGFGHVERSCCLYWYWKWYCLIIITHIQIESKINSKGK